MFLARRQFGSIARVYEVVAPFLHHRIWTFPGPRADGPLATVSGPGHCALGETPAEALALLQGRDEEAVEELYE